MNSPKRQRGVALLMVLLVVALVSVLAVTLSGRLQSSVLRTGNLQQAEQAYWYWLSAEEIIQEVLQQELKASEGVAHQAQAWYQQSAAGTAFPVEGGSIQGQMTDLQSCFNLNALRVTAGAQSNDSEADIYLLARRKAQLRMLMQSIDDDIEPYIIDVVVDSLADWLDADDRIDSSYGAETADYESQQFPHQAANTWLSHISEFRLVRGVSAQLYSKLLPYVCVIPGDKSLNVNLNTIAADQPQLLYAVSLGGIDLQQAERFLADRPPRGFNSVNDARNHPALVNAGEAGIQPNFGGGVIPPGVTAETVGGALDDFDVKSKYFQMNAKIAYGDLIMAAQSQFLITPESTEIIFRSVGEP